MSLCVYCYEGYMVRSAGAPRGGGAAHAPETDAAMCEMGVAFASNQPAVDPGADYFSLARPARRLLLPFAGGPLDQGGGEGGPLDGLHLRALAPRDGVAAAGAAVSPLGALLAQLPGAPAMPPERFRAQVRGSLALARCACSPLGTASTRVPPHHTAAAPARSAPSRATPTPTPTPTRTRTRTPTPHRQRGPA